MNMEEIIEQLEASSEDDTKEQVENVTKVKGIMKRKIKSLRNSGYQTAEIAFGNLIATMESLEEYNDSEKAEKIKELALRLLQV